MFKPAYTREIERNLGNQEQGECAWNQKDFGPYETLRPFPFGRLSPRSPFPRAFLSSQSPRKSFGTSCPPARASTCEMAQQPAVPCSKCGWLHRRVVQQVQEERADARGQTTAETEADVPETPPQRASSLNLARRTTSRRNARGATHLVLPLLPIAAALRTMDGAHDLTKVFPVIVRERQRRNGQAQ